MQKLIPLLGLSTALLFSTSAIAHEDGHDRVQFKRVGDFSDVDANGDGKVSEQEYLDYEKDTTSERRMEWRKNHWVEMTEKFDSNEDNQIEVEEINEYVDERMAETMEKLDDVFESFGGNFEFDFDDKHEFTFRLEEHLGEVEEHLERAMERVHEREVFVEKFEFGENEFIIKSHPGFAWAFPHMNDMSSMDENEDGKITPEEFTNSRSKMFERLDKNSDGVLDGDELEGMHFKGDFAFEWITREDEDNE